MKKKDNITKGSNVVKKVIIVIIVLAIVAVGMMIIRREEDTWICVDGQWQQHGQPIGPTPETGCGDDRVIENFDDCVSAGNAVMESYPRQCQAKGKTFTENIGNELELSDLVSIDSPRPNQRINSPLNISGQARGYWFFEGDFPIKLVDSSGNLMAIAIAQAQGEWMTEDFVSFIAEINFEKANATSGALILRRNNPSGLSANDNELRVPVTFFMP